MAAITTAGSGNWSSTTPNAPWPGGTVPTSADTVTIANGHTVTLDITGCQCLSVATAGTGTLTNTTSANWDFTLGNAAGDTANISIATGTLNLDMSSAASYTGTVYLNKGANTNGLGIQSSSTCSVTLKGANRQRWTRLNGAISVGATSAVVNDATGWLAGDKIIFGSTQAYNATPRIDEVTLTSVSGNTIGWTGGIIYDHADDGYVGNFSSNLIIRPYSTNKSYVALDNQGTRDVYDVCFDGLGGSVFPKYGLSLNGGNTTVANINNNAFYSTHTAQTILVYLRFLGGLVTRQDNVFYCTVGSIMGGQTSNGYIGNWERAIIFRSVEAGLSPIHSGEEFIDCVSFCSSSSSGGATKYGGTGSKLIRCSLGSSNNALYVSSGTLFNYLELEDCEIGTEFAATNNVVNNLAGSARSVLTNCNIQSSGTIFSGIPSSTKPQFIGSDFVNKNSDATSQESYYGHCNVLRDNSNITRSSSSIAIYPTIVSTDCQRTLSILCTNGSSIRIVGYVKKSHATNVSATVAITGLGSSVTPFTKANDTDWEMFDLSATNSSGSDGNFTLTYTANSSSGTSNVVYFDGVPDSPFVTKCRHYGFLIQESSPTRTVDPYAVAAEATAAAYTGVTINNTTKEISFAAGTADTAQKFYDYHQATICDNLGYDVAISRAGTLYSLLSTWTVVDPYYSGNLTWSGGTIQYSTYGTKSDNLDGCIIEFADTGGGTYTLNGTLSGTLDLRNLDADPITVEVPAGTTTTDANNTGGTITVTEPQVYQSVVLSSGEAGSRVQLYDVTSSTELYNDVPGSWPFTWTDPDPYSADREIRLRVAYTDGADARQFIDQTIGTVTEADPELTYLVAQIDDAVYNANAIDGSALTGYAIVGSNLTIDVSDGTATWAEMYAYQVYWLSTEGGIRDQDLFIFGIDTANYLFYGGFKIKNTSAPSVPLLVTGGNGEPSSGPATDLLDTTGGTIFCNSAIVVPYSSGAEVTEQIVRDGLTSQGYTTSRANAIDTIPEDVWGHTLP